LVQRGSGAGHQVAANAPHSTKGALAGLSRSEYGFDQRQPIKEKIGVDPEEQR
jgi:hypothetical protein